MPSVVNITPSGNSQVDGVLIGQKWASPVLTYSFPAVGSAYGSSYGYGETQSFAALNSPQQAVVRADLALYASVANLHFTEITGASAGGADLRFGNTGASTSGWAYTPASYAAAGDAWFATGYSGFNNPVKGGYAYLIMMHEIGHTLGFKDARDVNGAFGAEPASHDSLEYTVMSYCSCVGGSANAFTNGTFDYPQSLMMDDIAAIQALYGVNFANAGKSIIYTWSASTGEMFVNGVGQGAPAADKIFLTVWTGGAKATYDFSNYATDLHIDLQPGHWSTLDTSQLAVLDLKSDHRAAGNIANAYYESNGVTNDLVAEAVGGKGDDIILGNDADNHITGGAGDDLIDGGQGVNTAVYSGARGDYRWSTDADGKVSIQDLRSGAPDGHDSLNHIEFLQFKDGTVSLAIVRSSPNPVDMSASSTSASLPGASDLTSQIPSQASNQTASLPPAVPIADSAATDASLHMSPTQSEAALLDARDTSSVVTLTYQFFTGAIPTQAGMDYLLSATGSGLNSSYYADFTLEQRYISFSVNLGTKGEGGLEFAAAYGPETLSEAFSGAYTAIFGAEPSTAKIDILLHEDVTYDGATMARADYFEACGGSDIGTKAAMVGWLLAEAVQKDAGVYAQANNAFLIDALDGAAYNVDLIGAYGGLAADPL